MKKVLKVVAVVLCVLVIGGCGKEAKSEYEEDGTRVEESKSGKEVTIEKLPYDLEYNDKKITFNDVKIYLEESDYGYYILAVWDLDANSLTDKDLHWIDEEDAFDVRMYISDDENAIDFESMSFLCYYNAGDELKAVFQYNDEVKNPVSESAEFTCSFDIKQDEKYEYDKDEYGSPEEKNKTNKYTFYKNLTSADEVISTKEMDSELYKKIVDTLNSKAEVLKGLLNN